MMVIQLKNKKRGLGMDLYYGEGIYIINNKSGEVIKIKMRDEREKAYFSISAPSNYLILREEFLRKRRDYYDIISSLDRGDSLIPEMIGRLQSLVEAISIK